MKKTFILSCFSLLFSSLTINSENIIEYVNPIIGTNGMGHTFPGACVPFGVVQLSPDTDTIPHNVNGKYQGKVYEYCAGYQHRDNTIVGFSHTHLSGTGHSEEKAMATHSSALAWRIPGTGSLVGCRLWGRQSWTRLK